MYKGPKISLKSFDRKHLAKTRKWVNDPETALSLGRILPVSDMQHGKWFTNLKKAKEVVIFAIETNRNQKHVGNIWLWNIDWRHRKAEIRVVIGEKNYTGKGYGSEAISLITQFAFERLNLHKVYAYVIGFNKRAKMAFEKTGFIVEGVLKRDRFIKGKYEDVFLLAKLMEEGKT